MFCHLNINALVKMASGWELRQGNIISKTCPVRKHFVSVRNMVMRNGYAFLLFAFSAEQQVNELQWAS